MKRTISILILFIFIYNSIGFIAIQPLITIYVKRLGWQAALKPEKKGLIELIVLKKADILQKKINFKKISQKEFRLNGNIFDVVREVEKDSNIYFYCLNDKKEEELEKQFQKKLDENTASKQRRTGERISVKKIISEPICSLLFGKSMEREIRYTSINNRMIDQVCKDVTTPPPKI